MPNSFHCPSCGTLLELPGDTTISIQCPNCHAIAPVPDELRWSPAEIWLQKLQKKSPGMTGHLEIPSAGVDNRGHLPAVSTIETPPFPPAGIGISDEKSSGARTFRLIVGVLIILMMVAIAVLGLMITAGH